MGHLKIQPHTMERVLYGIAVLGVCSWISTSASHSDELETALVHLGVLGVVGGSFVLQRRGRQQTSARLLVTGLFLLLWLVPLAYGGVTSPVAFLAILPIALAFFLLGSADGLAVALTSTLVAITAAVLDPFLPADQPLDLAGTLITLLVSIALPSVVMHSTIEELKEARLRAEREARTAREASHAKSRFLANMSHELRTPLSSIIGFSELLQEEAEEVEPADLRGQLGHIETSAHHLLHLINDVLDLSKIEAGRMDLDIHPFDAKEPLAQVLVTAHALVESRGNTLVAEVGDLGVLYSDATKVAQCVLNLVGNAARFTERGTITVRAWRDIHRTLWVEVSDTGIGIAPEQLDRIFQEFTQAEPHTRREYGGTGLGLALTRALVELLQGDVSVESELGVGSTFRLSFPDLRQEPTSASSWPAMAEGEALSGT